MIKFLKKILIRIYFIPFYIFGYEISFKKISTKPKLPSSNYKNKYSINEFFIPKSFPHKFITFSNYGPLGLIHIPLGYANLANKLGLDLNQFSECLDLGAHHGSFSCWMSSLGIATYAVEALPENFNILTKNKTLNSFSTLTCINACVTSELACSDSKSTKFYFGSSSTTGSANPMVKDEIQEQSTVDLPNVCINQLINDIDSNNLLLKIDIEGSEWLLFEDLIKCMQSGEVSAILGEFHDCEYIGQKYLILSALDTIGWEYIYLDNDNGTLEIASCPKDQCLKK